VAVALLLRGPLTTLSGLLIYPGMRLDEALLERWLSRLKAEDSWLGLRARAAELISAQAPAPASSSTTSRRGAGWSSSPAR
jgi:hypothetical protein